MLMPATYVYSWRERSCLSDGRTVMDFVPQDRFQRGVRNSEPLLMLLKWLWMFPPIATKLRRPFVVGETVLKVKVPPARIENSLSPLGYRLFNSSRDFSDSLGRGEPVLLTQVFGLAPALDLLWLWTCSGFGLAPALDLPRLLDLIPISFEINEL